MWATSRGERARASSAQAARRSSRANTGFKALDAPLATASADEVLERLLSAPPARKYALSVSENNCRSQCRV